MGKIKIYTCGKMSGIPYDEQMKWRMELEKCVDCERASFVHPPLYFNYENAWHKSEREILEWEMAQLYDCNIVVVNLKNIESTIGSHMELGAVQGINRFTEKHIFVVGFGEIKENLHPWIKESCMRIEDNIEDIADYINTYLLV